MALRSGARSACLLAALLCPTGAAQALPEPSLTPSGPAWIGPLTPATPEVERRGRGWVTVDPITGQLHVEAVDISAPGWGGPLELRRVHTGQGWRFELDERLEVEPDGLRWVRAASTLTLPAEASAVRLPGDSADWPAGVRFGEGQVLRTEAGYEAEDAQGWRLFDAQGRLLTFRDPDGVEVNAVWEPEGLARLETPDGRVLSVLRDDAGRWTTLIGPSGEERYYHWREGQLVAVSGDDAPRTRYVEDAQGRLTAILWPDGSRLQARYDAEGRVKRVAGPGTRLLDLDWREGTLTARDGVGNTTTLTRGDDGVRVRDGAGRQAWARYDAQGLSGWVDPLGQPTRLTRDADGNIHLIEGPTGAWRLGWAAGALIELTDPAGGVWRLRRGSRGELIGLSDPDGFAWTFAWDPRGALTAVTRGLGKPTRFARDARGLISAITQPSGATTRLRRDARGRVIAVADPAGNELRLTAWRGATPSTLLGRGGARWTFSLDPMGRLARLDTPYDQALRFERDGAGRLTRLGQRDPGPGATFSWRADGRLSRMVDSRGATWGVSYDAGGHPTRVLLPDGGALELSWDASGQLASLGVGERSVEITRDPAGRPTALGPLRWGWDLLGRLVSVATDTLNIGLLRSGSGRVQQVLVGEDAPLHVLYNAAGRVTGVLRGDERWTLRRDLDGLLIGLAHPDGATLRVDRDERGLPLRVFDGETERRVLRDAAGWPLKWIAPDGSALSADRGLVGEPRLIRMPDGSLTALSWPSAAQGEADPSADPSEGGLVEAPSERVTTRIFEDPGGHVALDLRASLGPDGRPDRQLEGLQERALHRDAFGRLVSAETQEGAWTRTPGALAGPDGSLVTTDVNERPVEAIPPVGPAAWGVGLDALQYSLDAAGRVRAVLGEQGRAALSYSALDQLVEVQSPEGPWRVTWDPLGRPVRVTSPEGEVRALSWGLDRLLSWTDADGRTDLLSEPGWGYAALTASGALTPSVSLLVDAEGSPRVATAEGEVELLRWSPAGFPLEAPLSPISWRGLWSIFPGGPLLDGGGGWDPVSGRPLAPRWAPPARPGHAVPTISPEPIAALDGVSQPHWDPGPWMSESPFSDPLRLLIALGELDPLLGEAWTALSADAPALPWLPAAASTTTPMSPGLDGIPERLDPITALALRCALRGGGPLEERDLIEALMQAELGDQAASAWWGDPVPWGQLSPRWSPQAIEEPSY